MRCPVDNETLVMADRNGVEIDYCPKCRGVWLDRGELDKIIDRAGAGVGAVAAAPVAAGPEPVTLREPPSRERPRSHDDDGDHHRGGYRKKRRESFLSDLFDF